MQPAVQTPHQHKAEAQKLRVLAHMERKIEARRLDRLKVDLAKKIQASSSVPPQTHIA